jgi:hypothetical protein
MTLGLLSIGLLIEGAQNNKSHLNYGLYYPAIVPTNYKILNPVGCLSNGVNVKHSSCKRRSGYYTGYDHCTFIIDSTPWIPTYFVLIVEDVDAFPASSSSNIKGGVATALLVRHLKIRVIELKTFILC